VRRRVDKFALDLLDRFLTLNPDKRITAKEALEHEYFRSRPLPCPPSCLPKISSDTHEYQVKIQLKNAYLKQNGERKPPPHFPAKIPSVAPTPAPAPVPVPVCDPSSPQAAGLWTQKRALPQQAALLTKHLEPSSRQLPTPP
jgi:serine/threonine protein kinase